MQFATMGEGRGIKNDLGSGQPTEVQVQILYIARQGCLWGMDKRVKVMAMMISFPSF